MPLLQWPPRRESPGRWPIPFALPPRTARNGGAAGAQNALLAALPDGAAQRLGPKLQQVQLAAGAVLFEPGMLTADVYFPQSAVVAISAVLENGTSAEIALVGREGVVGVRLLLGQSRLNVRGRVQTGGTAVKLPVHCLASEMARDAALLQLLLRYTGAYIEGVVQTAACNRHGTVEQRVCRWLLLNLDRLPGDDLAMTHESIAVALGVKREGVTEVAGKLRRQGAIDYRRGHIKVLDRSALEHQVREFYGTKTHEPVEMAAQGG